MSPKHLNKTAVALVVLALLSQGCDDVQSFRSVIATPNPIHWIADYVFGKAIDGIWDAATGKPDVFALERRIRALESDPRWRSEYRDPLRDLVESISQNTTIDDYRRIARVAVDRIDDIDRRVAHVEGQVANHEVRITNLEQGNIKPNSRENRSRKAVIVDPAGRFTSLNQSNGFKSWPSESVKSLAGINSWNGWCPKEGDEGTVVSRGPLDTLDVTTDPFQPITKDVVILRIGNYYVPIDESAIRYID